MQTTTMKRWLYCKNWSKQPTSDTNEDTNGLIPYGNIEPAAHIPLCSADISGCEC